MWYGVKTVVNNNSMRLYKFIREKNTNLSGVSTITSSGMNLYSNPEDRDSFINEVVKAHPEAVVC